MAMKTFTLTRGGVTSTLGLNRDIEAGVNTFQKADGTSITVDRTASVITSDRAGESRPLLSKVAGAAAAAYSLRDLNSKSRDNKVVNVRRSGDNITRDFLAKEVANGTLENWVHKGEELPARTARLGQSNTNVSGFSSTWASDYKRVLINKSAVTSGNKKVRIYDFKTDVDNTISSFPAKLKVEFNVNQIQGDDLNTRTYTNRADSEANFGIYLSVKDDDVDVENPVYSNKRFFKINNGFNSIEFEIFNDGDQFTPSIDILANMNAFDLQLVISGISIQNVSASQGYVTKWHDQSGNGRDVAQSDTAKQPLIVENGSINVDSFSNPTIRFERDSQTHLTSDDDDDLNPNLDVSAFVVQKDEQAVTPATSANSGWVAIRDSSSVGNSSAFELGVNNNSVLFRLTHDPNADNINKNTQFVGLTLPKLSTTSIIAGIKTSEGNLRGFHNGSTILDTTVSDNTDLGNNYGITIGKHTYSTQYADGRLNEVILYLADQTLNRPAIEANIANQYGITLS
jgi:hypothetical protein